MTTSDLRNTTVDTRLLKMIKALAESYQSDDQETFTLSEEQYQIIDKRREAHLKIESQSFSCEQVKKKTQERCWIMA